MFSVFRLFVVVDQDLLRDLEASNSEVHLVEGLRLVKSIAVLSAHLVSMQVLLGSPGCAIEEVHGSVEPTCSDCSLTLERWLHRGIKVDAIHVGNLLS